MPSAFEQLVTAHAGLAVLVALAASLGSIALLLGVIVARRWLRARFFRRRDARVLAIREKWDGIVAGAVPPQEWIRDPLAREVVETLLLDMLEGARGRQMQPLVECLRRSGLLDRRIAEARVLKGWKRRAALVSLGRTRAPEALPALTEALNSPDPESVIAAMRGIGRMAIPHAADPVLRKLLGGTLHVPPPVLKNTLISCCRDAPAVLLPFLGNAEGATRDTLARILGELADSAEYPELLVLSADPVPEVRSSAARGLARLRPEQALAPLAALCGDPEWFVRLRAVVALGALRRPAAIPALVRALCDRNQLVRQRAAWALLQFSGRLPGILSEVLALRDEYGLHALVAEMDCSGITEEVCLAIGSSGLPGSNALLSAIATALRDLGRPRPAALAAEVAHA